MKNKKTNIAVILVLICLLIVSGCGRVDENKEVPDALSEVTEDNLTVEQESTVVTEVLTTEEATDTEGTTDKQLTICMVGDILLHTPIEEISRRDDGTYDYSALFDNVREEVQEADIAIVNEEVIIGGKELGVSGYPAFNASYEIGDALAEAGFDVVCHATNHALDKGRSGLLNCISYWKQSHPEMEILGIHESAEDAQVISYFDTDIGRIAILNYTYGTNGINLPSDMPFGVDLLSESRIIEDLDEAEECADFTIVCPHWGTEYRLEPDSSQLKWAKLMTEHGADLILGTHPHVIEPIEWVEEEDNSALVYYSIGNYVNWTSGTGAGVANRMVGGMATVTLGRDSGTTVIMDYGVRPVISHVTSAEDGVTTFFLSEYSEELAAQNEIVSQDPTFSYEYCRSLCDEVWGTLWR